ncbi:peptidyl-alpha-hydroxyglycine alpha-amidating lyase family protein [Arenicella sp.]|nr:peptidyl-alpha-hydroxyglycine alpha-amidating lyase family protein [Arenicella sp.]
MLKTVPMLSRFVLVMFSLLLSGAVSAEDLAAKQSDYKVQHGWPQLPEGFALAVPGGVDIDHQGRVFSVHTGGRAWPDRNTPELIANKTVMVWDEKTGKLLDSWGENTFRMTHGLTVDKDSNVWATDVGLHQVFKFTDQGELIFALGEASTPGDKPGYFNMPTDIAVLDDGSFYVSDGYGNNRIVKYSADGEYQFEWGKGGTGPGEFNLPHSVALDSEGKVYVADRGNFRIQIFSPEGEYLSEIKTDGWMPYALIISADNKIFVTDGGDKPAKYPFRSRVLVLDLEGNILDTFGRYGNYDGQFILAHDIGISPGGDVFVADVVGNRIQKFVKSSPSQ